MRYIGTSRQCVALGARACNGCNVRAPRYLPHRTNEAKTSTRQRFDQALLLAGIADSIPGGVQAGRQCGIGDDASVPNGTDEVVLAYDALPVSNQVDEQVKDLRRD